MNSYTQLFTEGWELAGVIEAASHSSEQNSGRIDVSPYTRLWIEIYGADGGANAIAVDLEQADAASGGTLKALHASDLDTDVAADEYMHVIEVRCEQFDTNLGFRWLNVEMTPAGARVCGVHVWGLAKDEPADNALIATIVSS